MENCLHQRKRCQNNNKIYLYTVDKNDTMPNKEGNYSRHRVIYIYIYMCVCVCMCLCIHYQYEIARVDSKGPRLKNLHNDVIPIVLSKGIQALQH